MVLLTIKNTLEMKLVKEYVLSYVPSEVTFLKPETLAGRMGLYAAGIFLGLMLVCCIQCCFFAVYYISKLRRAVVNLRNKLLWNMFIKVFQGGYLTYQFSSLVYIVLYDYTKFYNIFEFVVSVLIVTLVVCLGIVQYQYVMSTSHRALDLKKDRYGSIFAGIDTRRPQALKQVGIFYLSRTLAAAFMAVPHFAGFLHAMWVMWLLGLCAAFTWAVKPNYLTKVDLSWNQHYVEMLNNFAFYYLIMLTLVFT